MRSRGVTRRFSRHHVFMLWAMVRIGAVMAFAFANRGLGVGLRRGLMARGGHGQRGLGLLGSGKDGARGLANVRGGSSRPLRVSLEGNIAAGVSNMTALCRFLSCSCSSAESDHIYSEICQIQGWLLCLH